jgi:hypothetical protein
VLDHGGRGRRRRDGSTVPLRKNSNLYPEGTKATLTEDGLANVVLTSPNIGGLAVATARAGDADGQIETGFEIMASENRIYRPLIGKE